MLSELQQLVRDLKKENADRSDELNDPKISSYGHTAKVHMYNNTLDVIKRLEKIIGKVY